MEKLFTTMEHPFSMKFLAWAKEIDTFHTKYSVNKKLIEVSFVRLEGSPGTLTLKVPSTGLQLTYVLHRDNKNYVLKIIDAAFIFIGEHLNHEENSSPKKIPKK